MTNIVNLQSILNGKKAIAAGAVAFLMVIASVQVSADDYMQWSYSSPVYLNTTEQTGLVPDFNAVPEALWRRCQLIYICTPGNPTGRPATPRGKPVTKNPANRNTTPPKASSTSSSSWSSSLAPSSGFSAK